jgi:hypothetical protein
MEESETVFDERAGPERDRRRGEYPEVELRRGDPLEIVGIGKEGERLVPGEGQPEAPGEPVGHLPARTFATRARKLSIIARPASVSRATHSALRKERGDVASRIAATYGSTRA